MVTVIVTKPKSSAQPKLSVREISEKKSLTIIVFWPHIKKCR